jgi:SulP family sulfate permease
MPGMTTGLRATLARWLGPWVLEVDRACLRADLSAGLLGALLVLPQAIAFASLAGLPPQYGLYGAMLPGLVAALAGSSRHVVTGPTNANSLALAAMLAPMAATGSPEYIELALAVTVMVGLMQALVGLLRLGLVAHFVSPAALLGFTSGAAVLIGVHALRDLLQAGVPGGLAAWEVLRLSVAWLGEANLAALATGLTAVVLGGVLRRAAPRWPFMLLALLGSGLLGAAMAWRGWHADVLGPLPVQGWAALPDFHLPQVAWSRWPELFEKALALSVIALGQSLSIAKVLAARTGQPLDVNREFVGQGLANIAGGLGSAYLVCGSLNRSLPNLEAGARTPLAGVASALWVLLLVALFAPALALIPKAGIAGLLVLVAWSLFDRRAWGGLWRHDRAEWVVAGATFAGMLVLRLESAILLGTVGSLVLYLYRTSRPAMRVMGFRPGDPARRFIVRQDTPDALPECPQLRLLRMEGPIYFGAAAHVQEQLAALRRPDGATTAAIAPAREPARAPEHLLVMAKSMNFLDLAGAQVWEEELVTRRAAGGDLWFHRPRPQVVDLWRRTGFLARLGEDHVLPDKRSAIARIVREVDAHTCRRCRARCFEECSPVDPGARI